ncbi:MAG: VOC family protein [Inquilinus sp.]|nr:VOC family protein [Inquilinus sp.]
MKLYSIRLLVTDFDACFRFYRDTLGLEPVWGEEGGRYADFKVGNGTLIALFRRDLMAAAVGAQDLPTNASAQDKAAIILQVDDIDRTVARLRSKGTIFLTEPKDYPEWTIRAAYLRDPEANLIELFSALPEAQWSEDARDVDRRTGADR